MVFSEEDKYLIQLVPCKDIDSIKFDIVTLLCVPAYEKLMVWLVGTFKKVLGGETVCKGFCPLLIKYWPVYQIVTKIEFFVATPIFQYKVDVRCLFFNKKLSE